MKAIWMAAVLALSMGTVACGGGEGACKSTCKKAADCEGAPDGYQDDCEKLCEEFAETADEAGCKSEFNKAAKCGKKEFDCEGSGDACSSESEDLGKCILDAE